MYVGIRSILIGKRIYAHCKDSSVDAELSLVILVSSVNDYKFSFNSDKIGSKSENNPLEIAPTSCEISKLFYNKQNSTIALSIYLLSLNFINYVIFFIIY
jgi:hypothetical protein